MLARYPFLTLRQSLIVLRVATAVFFMAHAVVRITGGTVPRFGGFLESKGLPAGVALVWAITAYELIAGALMLAGKYVRACTLGFLGILAGGIVLIHAQLGWFVGEHGTGGVEYSLALAVALLVIAAADRER
jgi:putative oxidoreductase